MKASIKNTIMVDLKGYSEKIISKTVDNIENFITNVEISATRDAPRFLSIDKKFENKGLTAEVGVMGGQIVATGESSGSNMAAYWEFGTGLSAAEITAGYPAWVKELAMEYFVSGKGTLVGQPYLFNNFLNYLPKFQKEQKKIMDEEEKK